jgi:hypothetical protein
VTAALDSHRARPDAPVGSVYYAQRDGLIKIGFSRHIPGRMLELKATLLAIELGGRDMVWERIRQHQFKHLRVSGEWFVPGRDLLAHIDRLIEASA